MLTYTNFLKCYSLPFALFLISFSAFSQTPPLVASWAKVGSNVKPLIVTSSTTGDVNGDGLLDFIAQHNLLQLGNTSTFFSQLGNDWGINTTFNAHERHGYLGDHNGDGKKDVVLIKNNQIAVFNGSSTGLPLLPSQSFTTDCDACGVNRSFDGNGDINKDGYDDLIVGAPLKAYPNGSEGAIYIYYGSATGLNFSTPTIIDQANYIGTHFGSQVRYAGDVNKDGFSDILVASETFSGRGYDEEVFILFGRIGTPSAPLKIGNGGHNFEDYAHEIGAAGDINGDGFADFYISAAGRYTRNPFLTGKVEIVYGKANGSLDANIRVLEPPIDVQEGIFGKSVCRAGDFNDDGFSDLAITFNNKVLIYLGTAQGLSPEPRFEFLTCCSPTVRYAGDVDKDGLSDILVGEQNYNSGDGRIQLVKGRPSMIPNFGVQKRDLCIDNPKAIFRDSSIGTVSQVWDFGDGTQSSLKNPEHTYTRAGIFAVKLTTKNAKGQSWNIKKDSAVIVRAPLTAGNYTVGEGATFLDMTMVNTVCACGISGNVNIRFKNGVYAPPTLRLENVETNGFTITFEPESGIRDSVQFGPMLGYIPYWTAQPNIIVKNTKNVTFKKLRLVRMYDYTDPAIQLKNSENIKFDNCIFPVQNFEKSNNINAHTVKNLRFDSCLFFPSYPILHATKCEDVTINKSNAVLNDDSREFGYISIDSSQNIQCTQSFDFYINIRNANVVKVDKSGRLGIRIFNSKKIEITENGDNMSVELANIVGFKINRNRHQTTGAYSLNGVTGIDTEGYNLIANNFIGFPRNAINYSSGGIHILDGKNIKIYHNSIVFESFQGENCKGTNLRVQNSDSVDVRNNVFLQAPNTECAFVQIDNNQRYTANFNAYCNNRFFNNDVWNSHFLLNFNEFKETLGQDQNSMLGTLKMQADLLTPNSETAGLINNAAPFLAEVSEDINGKRRLQAGGVDIGALEFNAPNYRDFSLDTIRTNALTVGSNPISILFTNRSSSTADSCRFAYQINDNPVVREKWTGRLAGFTSSIYTFSTPLSILKGKTYIVKAWLENTAEATRQNDTVVKMIVVPMSGTYSIGGDSDFKNVIDFYNELEIADTEGDVIGLVQTGNYTFIDPSGYRSTGQKHWVTLKGEGSNPDNVHLYYNLIDQFIDQPYQRFENMTLETPGVLIHGVKLEINNCVVKSVANALNERYYLSVYVDSSVVVKNTQFINLSYALQISMAQVNFQENNHSKIWIENCHFSNIDTAIAIRHISIANINILKNTIDTANIGLYLINISVGQGGDTGKTFITQNQIINCREMGIWAGNVQNALFANNFVEGKEASMEFRSPTACKVIHNSCFGTFKMLYISLGNEVLNNSFVAENTPMIGEIVPSPFTHVYRRANFNNYFSLNNKPCKIVNSGNGSQTDMSLNEFRQLFQTDSQSIAVNPRYKSTTDMHIDSLSPLNGAGGGIFFNVKTDFDGQERDSLRNEIGADEVKPLSPSVVMPGDANFDGVVDMYDLVSVGVAIPQQLRGTARSNASIEWLPQPSVDWSTTVLGKNAKHADTNGDGVVNVNDTLAISRNYTKTHTNHLRARSSAALLYLSNLPTVSTEGNWVTANVNLGSVTNKATGVYALLFSIQYDTSKIKVGSLSLKFDTCWIAQNNQRLTMTKDIGRLYVGLVRTTGTTVSGNGVIGQLRFQLKDAVLGKALISLLDGVIINNNGIKQEIATQYDTLTVKLAIPPTINLLLGTSQTTLVDKPFASPIRIQVKTASGKVLPNLLVRFVLPNGNTPSATFVNGQKSMTSLTNTEGVAQSMNFVANGREGTYNATVMLEDSTVKLIQLTNTTTTAIGTFQDTQLSVFPNPSTDIITLKRNGINDNSTCFWELYDIVGRQLSKGQFDSESINISLAQFSTQLFVLKTIMNGKNGIYKLERLP